MPPQATLESITSTGLVTIKFTEDMRVMDKIEVQRITKRIILETGEPVFDFKVI